MHLRVVRALDGFQTRISVQNDRQNIEDNDNGGIQRDVFYRDVGTALPRKLIENILRYQQHNERSDRADDILQRRDKIYAPGKLP